MAQDLGGIYYEVDLETGNLIASVRKAKGELDSLSKNSDTLNTSLSRLSSTIKLVIASSALREMASMVQKYQEMADRVRMATASTEEFDMVQKRLLKTANGTFRSLSEAQELYIRSADGLRSMGYSTQQAIDVQDSMSYAFVKNAASADRASSAINAFTKSINTGKVSADQWESITSAIPSVIEDIASASNKSAADVRALGAAGKLSAKQLTEGLKQSLDANAESAKGMSNNLTDASVRIKTAITAVLVAAENQTGALQSFTNGLISAADAILSFSDNEDGMKNLVDATTAAITVFSAVIASRYVGSLAAATQAKVTHAVATIKQRDEEIRAAQAAIASAQAEIKNAQATIASEQAKARQLATQSAINKQYGLAVSYQAEYAAIQQKITAADNAATAAKARLAAATELATNLNKSYALSATLARNALAFIGGPAGAAMLAASAIFYFWQQAKQAKEESINFADSLDGVIAKMREMNQVQLQGTLADIAKSITAQKEKIDDLNDSVSDAQREYEKYIGLARKFGVEQDQTNGYVQKANEWFYTLSQRKRDLSDATDKLNKTQHQQAEIQEQLNTKAKESDAAFDVLANNLRTKIPNASEAAIAAMAATMQTLDSLNKKASESGKAAEPEPSPEAKKLIQNAERRLALSKLEGEARARLQAQYDAEDVGLAANDPVTKQLQDRYAQTEKNTKAQKEANSESKKSASSAESVAQKLKNLRQQSELAADSTRELSREQAIQRAKDSLGKSANPGDIKLAEEYARKIWDTANALKAQAAAEKLIPERQESTRYAQESKDLKTALDAKKITQDEFNQATERAEQQHQSNLAKIRSDAVVSPINDARGSIDPVQQLANENARKLALIQQFETEKGAITERGIALMTAANKQYEQDRIAAQWEIWRQQSVGNEAAAAAFDSFAGNASNALTGIITRSMTAEDALRSIGSNALNSLVNTFVQMGVEWVKSAVMGQAAQTAAIGTVTAVQTAAVATQTATSTAAAATTAAAWTPAAILSSVASMGTAAAIGLGAVAGVVGANLLGKRKNGGPVTAGGMYQVGEGGMPEIYQASTGKQYMIPGDNGKVISNKDMTAGGGGGVVINIQNYTSSSVDAQASTDSNGGLTVDVIVADLNNGGPISNAITSNMNVKRTPRGQG
ncbi:tape measure protein [Cedecea neteri]|uniref:tape measure protein n=1 Tax=Cedecea neteri TaxID=158822 RepID=UPI0028999544|nr:tape measure protein [Cedecea neteri]